ncbi:MAG: DUF3575 domain-containing protein [Bacteroidota bacterium]
MTKKTLVLCGLLFICTTIHCTAQTITDSITIRKPGFILKIAPLSILDVDPTYQLALEYFLNRQWSIQQEMGYGNKYILSPNVSTTAKPNAIWRLRTEVRYYLGRPLAKTTVTGAYFALEGLYKQVHTQKSESVGRDCDNGNCAYFQELTYTSVKEVAGIHLKMGKQWLLGKSKRFALDVYSGVGWRMIFLKSADLPEGTSISAENFRTPFFSQTSESGRYSYPSLSAGFKVGYLFYKKPKAIK